MSPEATLVHRDFGGSGHPPLVILHGVLGSSRNWQTAGRDLASRYHVLALDLRNHGESPHAGGMTFGSMADDVLAWMDARGLRRVTLLGHSMGGKVAMLLACRSPGRVARLVVVDIVPKDYAWAGQRAAFAAMNALDLGKVHSRADAEKAFLPWVPELGLRRFLATNLVRADGGGWRWQVNLPVLSGALAALERNPLAPGDRYPGPVLLVSGGRSSYVEAADWPSVKAHFPAATWSVMPESGHNPHMDARAQFVRTVLEAG
jgi:pimeloyl-ACP methyl ester carboxylesterase